MSGNNNSAHLPAYTQDHIKRHLIAQGASGTIYAYAFPESRQVVHEILDGGVQADIVQRALREAFASATAQNLSADALAAHVSKALADARLEYDTMFDAAWTSKQDHVDHQFFDAWTKWSAPVVTLSPAHHTNHYPTAGASEGLREVINAYANKARVEGFTPTVHVFHGEYEGFGAYSDAAGVNVVRHDRANWKESIAQIGERDQFYISQPSAIDGNVWDEFDDFAQSLHAQRPGTQLMLDLTYVGSVAKDFRVNADHPNIPTVFFSLSKPFGVYYHRIGGVMTRETYPGLLGNKWFKGLQAMRTGTALLERSGVYELPRKYDAVRQEALGNVSRRLGVAFNASDVTLFATAPPSGTGEIETALLRGAPGDKFMRICITPEIARLMNAESALTETDPILPPRAVNGPHLKDM